MILRIAGNPPRNYYREPSARPLLPAKEAAHMLLDSVGTLRSTATGETANLTCVLRPTALRYMALPPLGATATLSDGGEVLHTGRVVSVDWSEDGLAVEMQA